MWLANVCKPNLSIPGTLADMGKMDRCQDAIQHSARGHWNPSFLGLTEEEIAATPAEDLPKFGDLFEPLEPGPFLSGHVTLRLPRLTRSILSNADSPSATLTADLFFPAGKGSTSDSPILSESGPFPIVGFSAGFGGKPMNHRYLLKYLASYGYIVVSQVFSVDWGFYVSVLNGHVLQDDFRLEMNIGFIGVHRGLHIIWALVWTRESCWLGRMT